MGQADSRRTYCREQLCRGWDAIARDNGTIWTRGRYFIKDPIAQRDPFNEINPWSPKCPIQGMRHVSRQKLVGVIREYIVVRAIPGQLPPQAISQEQFVQARGKRGIAAHAISTFLST
ncbi:MAG: hypothetical protein NVSMB52_03820 [Chloroflexota bacterium]